MSDKFNFPSIGTALNIFGQAQQNEVSIMEQNAQAQVDLIGATSTQFQSLNQQAEQLYSSLDDIFAKMERASRVPPSMRQFAAGFNPDMNLDGLRIRAQGVTTQLGVIDKRQEQIARTADMTNKALETSTKIASTKANIAKENLSTSLQIENFFDVKRSRQLHDNMAIVNHKRGLAEDDYRKSLREIGNMSFEQIKGIVETQPNHPMYGVLEQELQKRQLGNIHFESAMLNASSGKAEVAEKRRQQGLKLATGPQLEVGMEQARKEGFAMVNGMKYNLGEISKQYTEFNKQVDEATGYQTQVEGAAAGMRTAAERNRLAQEGLTKIVGEDPQDILAHTQFNERMTAAAGNQDVSGMAKIQADQAKYIEERRKTVLAGLSDKQKKFAEHYINNGGRATDPTLAAESVSELVTTPNAVAKEHPLMGDAFSKLQESVRKITEAGKSITIGPNGEVNQSKGLKTDEALAKAVDEPTIPGKPESTPRGFYANSMFQEYMANTVLELSKTNPYLQQSLVVNDAKGKPYLNPAVGITKGGKFDADRILVELAKLDLRNVSPENPFGGTSLQTYLNLLTSQNNATTFHVNRKGTMDATEAAVDLVLGGRNLGPQMVSWARRDAAKIDAIKDTAKRELQEELIQTTMRPGTFEETTRIMRQLTPEEKIYLPQRLQGRK